MFTGLVELQGRIECLARRGDTWELTVAHPAWVEPLVDGESVAVQGACLTVAAHTDGRFVCNVLDETLGRTTLAECRPGDGVNLERALRMGDRLGGHLVAGHVDGIGTVQGFSRDGADWVLEVACAGALCREMVPKGSIAVDGVSLTLTGVGAERFAVRIIPVTRAHTTLRHLNAGDRVNIETDMIAKYVRKVLAGHDGAGEMTAEHLQRAGFL